jgi:monoterpene epsilon-lactone hydrolase
MPSLEFERFYQTLQQAPVSDATLTQQRADFEKRMAAFPAAPDIKFDYFSIGSQTAAWVHAPQATRSEVILFFHGGGYTAGSIRSHEDLLGRLSRATGKDILAVQYRLAPDHPYPAALEDAHSAYTFLLNSHSEKQIILAGVSAGGGLLLCLLLSLKQKKKKLPKAGICICPWVDLALTGKTIITNDGKDIMRRRRIEKAAEAYLQNHDPKDPLVSPLYGDLHGLPPLIIQAGSNEILLDEIQRFAQKALESHVEVYFEIFDSMFHTWQLFASQIPEGVEALEKIGKHLKKL